MSIEENIFKCSTVDLTKLEKYGFKKNSEGFVFEKLFMDGDFKAIVKVNDEGKISSEVYDTASDDVYFPLRAEEMTAGFVGEVRAAYEKILNDIKNYCCTESFFVLEQTNRITEYILQKYGDAPDFPWEKYKDCGVFRNSLTNKWYGLIMTINQSWLVPKLTGKTEIINIKLSPDKIRQLLQVNGFYPAYHMNKNNWITLVLDGTIDDDTIMELIEESHSFTLSKKKRHL